jgi:hypothetical protein
MAKQNYLLDYFQNPANRDDPPHVVSAGNPNRLCIGYKGGRGDWNTVAGFISGLRRWPVTWFPDANVAFVDQTEVVWDALRLAALAAC